MQARRERQDGVNLVRVSSGIINGSQEQIVDARELHTFLQCKSQFADWIKSRISECRFIENQDFTIASENSEAKRRGGHNRTDYHLTLDMAKHLAMMERNEIGDQVRRYFIQIEKAARANVGTGGTAKALPARATLDADTVARINRHAWALAQATFERFGRELTADIEHRRHRAAVEDWQPREYRAEFFEQLAANAMFCHTFGDNLDRNAAQFAQMAGVDYAALSAKFRPAEQP